MFETCPPHPSQTSYSWSVASRVSWETFSWKQKNLKRAFLVGGASLWILDLPLTIVLSTGLSFLTNEGHYGGRQRMCSWNVYNFVSPQVIKMLILVVILFLLCWGPRLVMEIVVKCCLSVFNHGVYTVRIIFYLLPFVHSCLNPIVYCFMSSKFRRRMLRCCQRTCQVPKFRVKSTAAASRSSSRNGTTRLGSMYTFTSCATSTVALPSSVTTQVADKMELWQKRHLRRYRGHIPKCYDPPKEHISVEDFL